MKRIKILVADDHELIHNGIVEMLHSEKSFDIVGHAYNGKEAIDLTIELEPDIILMDISMPVLNGIEASRQILRSNINTRIIALSQYEGKEYISQMLKVGCQGYLLKNSKKDEIIEALITVSSGKKYLNPEMIDLLINSELKSIHEIPPLTNRELEILQMIGKGKSNPEIANFLSISVRTVETHRRNLMQKLEVNTVVDLLRYASRNNLIDL